VSPYTPHAQIADSETMYGRLHQPTAEQLLRIEAYREAYEKVFGAEPAGTHWIDTLGELVMLRRHGGLPAFDPSK
jgi:hypothetical protein